jgi:hypothetical protein
VKDGARFLIPIKGSAHTGFQTMGLFAMAALEPEGKRSFFFHEDPRQGPRVFLLECLENIFGL